MKYMTIDQWFKFYGETMFSAVDEVAAQPSFYYFMRACWNYWSINHCAGFPKDSARLRRICRVNDEALWNQIEPVIFGQLFILDGDLWHHEHLRALRSESDQAHQSRVLGGKMSQLKQSSSRPPAQLKLSSSPVQLVEKRREESESELSSSPVQLVEKRREESESEPKTLAYVSPAMKQAIRSKQDGKDD